MRRTRNCRERACWRTRWAIPHTSNARWTISAGSVSSRRPRIAHRNRSSISSRGSSDFGRSGSVRLRGVKNPGSGGQTILSVRGQAGLPVPHQHVILRGCEKKILRHPESAKRDEGSQNTTSLQFRDPSPSARLRMTDVCRGFSASGPGPSAKAPHDAERDADVRLAVRGSCRLREPKVSDVGPR